MQSFSCSLVQCICSTIQLQWDKAAVREKMIFRILLLLILNSCICASTFVVNVTQSSYQAEEKQNITLEWTFTTKPDSSSSSLFIYCELTTHNRLSAVFHVFKGVEASLYQDKQFVGRVQNDKDALRGGRIRLHVSGLRSEDSGLYKCQVNTEYGWGSASCQLNITEAADELQPQRPTKKPEPEREGDTFLYVAVGLGAALVLPLFIIAISCVIHVRENRNKRKSVPERVKKQPFSSHSIIRV
ncbi:uncharacterized protein [Leuresthes tenuis]|uniref:uncharacterized protein isoform X2 n=1 Tax=Leuresthes tenuis TaxID=355514 RepID=UPI003B504ADF